MDEPLGCRRICVDVLEHQGIGIQVNVEHHLAGECQTKRLDVPPHVISDVSEKLLKQDQTKDWFGQTVEIEDASPVWAIDGTEYQRYM